MQKISFEFEEFCTEANYDWVTVINPLADPVEELTLESGCPGPETLDFDVPIAYLMLQTDGGSARSGLSFTYQCNLGKNIVVVWVVV